MKISRIFELLNGSLYSARFDKDRMHAFQMVLSQWRDIEYLTAFFEEHVDDLRYFWPETDVQKAVMLTIRESWRIEREILNVAISGQQNRHYNLSILFQPLHTGRAKVEEFEKNKWKPERRGWLRLYAVRIDVNLYVISGGAIKLTRTMNERPHLREELVKLDTVCQYLRKATNGDYENEADFGFVELL